MRTAMIASVALTLSLLLSHSADAADADVDPVLQQLDQVGRTLKEFSAKVRLTTTDIEMGKDPSAQVGRAYFQKKADGSARMHVIFDHRIVGNRIYNDEKKEYLLDGQWLIDRNYRSHNEAKHQVLRPGPQMDLLKLGEGPFPLPIGQAPADVHRSFDVQKVAASKNDPKNTVHLQLIPKVGADLGKKLHSVEVWVDQRTHMPTRVDTLDFKQNIAQSTDLTDIVLNPPARLKDADFELPNIDKQNWNRTVDSLNN